MTTLDHKLRTLNARSRLGWALPYVNFAGKGFCFNLGARPRSKWDFNAKIHDMMFFVNSLSFSLSPPQEPLERSRLEKADYIFRQLSPFTDTNLPESFYNKVSTFIFLGKDRTGFVENDNFSNAIHHPNLTLENGHFMIPWSEIPQDEQQAIQESAVQEATRIVETQNLTFIKERFAINTAKKWRTAGGARTRVRETDYYRKKRLILEISQELTYNTRASIDDEPWRLWAKNAFGEIWTDLSTIQ